MTIEQVKKDLYAISVYYFFRHSLGKGAHLEGCDELAPIYESLLADMPPELVDVYKVVYRNGCSQRVAAFVLDVSKTTIWRRLQALHNYYAAHLPDRGGDT